MNIYLIHGADEEQLFNERRRIVDRFLPVDQRDENLTTFEPPGNRPLTLRALLPDLMAELGAVSFFPGAPRVVIVENLSDFWTAGEEDSEEEGQEEPAKAAKGKQKPIDPVERLIRFLETDFATTESILIFVVAENPEQRKTVDKRKKIVQWIKDNGTLLSFESKPLAWQLDDAIHSKNLKSALELLREALRKGRSGQAAWGPFSAIQKQVQFLLQAKAVAAASRRRPQPYIEEELLPKDPKANLLRLHRFPKGKILEAAPRFSTAMLIEAIHDLAEINRHLAPGPGEAYVADVGVLMEKVLIRLCREDA